MDGLVAVEVTDSLTLLREQLETAGGRSRVTAEGRGQRTEAEEGEAEAGSTTPRTDNATRKELAFFDSRASIPVPVPRIPCIPSPVSREYARASALSPHGPLTIDPDWVGCWCYLEKPIQPLLFLLRPGLCGIHTPCLPPTLCCAVAALEHLAASKLTRPGSLLTPHPLAETDTAAD